MKGFVFLLLTSISAIGQAPGKGNVTANVIAFDRADLEHCSVVIVEHRPMLQTIYNGTSVAVGLPVSTAEGDFRVFIVVRQIGPGKAQVKPKDFSALHSDPSHTRFSFYDKAAEVDKRTVRQNTKETGVLTAGAREDPSLQGVTPTPGPEANSTREAMWRRAKNEDLNRPTRELEQNREEDQSKSPPGVSMTPDELYLRRSTLRQGSYAEGFVYFRKPKGSTFNIGSHDLLVEIDIPVNGIVFRFG